MICLVVDVSSNQLLGVFPSRGKAMQCADNTPAHCVILELPANRIVGEWLE